MRYIIRMEDEAGTELVLIDITKLPGTAPDDVSFNVAAVIDRSNETSIYNRNVHHVNTLRFSPLGILQAVMDELPEEAHQLG